MYLSRDDHIYTKFREELNSQTEACYYARHLGVKGEFHIKGGPIREKKLGKGGHENTFWKQRRLPHNLL